MSRFADVAFKYVQDRYPEMGKRFFDQAWSTLNERFASERQTAREGGSIAEQPLGMAGQAKTEPLKAIAIFVVADRLSAEGLSADALLSEVQKIAERYDQQERATQEILTILRTTLGAGVTIDRGSTGRETGYRLWSQTSEPAGELLSALEKDKIVADKKKRDLIVLDEGTRTTVFILGRSVDPPPPLLYRILILTLKHKGSAGTSLQIASNVFSIEDNWGFRDLDALLAAIRMQPDLYKNREAELNDELFPIGDNLAKVQSNIRKRVGDLKGYLAENGLAVDMRAIGALKQYQFDPLPDYRLIEPVAQ